MTPDQEFLTDSDIHRAVVRIAHEILERNRGADDVVLLGIPTRGVPLAKRIAAAMAAIEQRRSSPAPSTSGCTATICGCGRRWRCTPR